MGDVIQFRPKEAPEYGNDCWHELKKSLANMSAYCDALINNPDFYKGRKNILNEDGSFILPEEQK